MRRPILRQGFTLLELMISLTILMTISSLMLIVTGSGRVSWSVAAAKLYLASQERQASNVIQQELSLSEYGSRFSIPADKKSVRFSIPLVKAGGTDDEALDITATGDLKWGDGVEGHEGYSIEYFIPDDTTDLVRRVLNTSAVEVSRRIIARNVQSFSIASPVNTRQYLITINFYIERYLGGRLPTPISNDMIFYITPMN
ncbi:MAG: type II secretion system protein [Candidatus Omnitrophota bacterium]|jgi:prepilin-type N-terminal cleavage/methylation domain-containing protein